MGFNLDVPAGGIVGVNDTGEEFLGIFANLRLATAPMPSPLVRMAETELTTGTLRVDPASLTFEHFAEGSVPGADDRGARVARASDAASISSSFVFGAISSSDRPET